MGDITSRFTVTTWHGDVWRARTTAGFVEFVMRRDAGVADILAAAEAALVEAGLL